VASFEREGVKHSGCMHRAGGEMCPWSEEGLLLSDSFGIIFVTEAKLFGTLKWLLPGLLFQLLRFGGPINRGLWFGRRISSACSHSLSASENRNANLNNIC
jgi:hypothetical protein